MVSMNDLILGADDVTKTNTVNVSTFQCPNFGPLGYMHNGHPTFRRATTAKHTTASEFDVTNLNELPKVDIIYGYANANAVVVDALVKDGAKGIIHAGVGNGNLYPTVMDALVAAQKDGIQVVRSSRVFSGSATLDAEVDDDKYNFYDLKSWIEVSELKAQFEEHENDDWVHTVSFAVRVPKVIRLLLYDRFPDQAVKFNRRNIFARDENRCQYCGKKFSTSELSLEHIVPRSRGGESSWQKGWGAWFGAHRVSGGMNVMLQARRGRSLVLGGDMCHTSGWCARASPARTGMSTASASRSSARSGGSSSPTVGEPPTTKSAGRRSPRRWEPGM